MWQVVGNDALHGVVRKHALASLKGLVSTVRHEGGGVKAKKMLQRITHSSTAVSSLAVVSPRKILPSAGTTLGVVKMFGTANNG